MNNWLFISLFLALCSIWLWLHYSAKSAQKHDTISPTKIKPPKNYHAISIDLCSQPCRCVCDIRGQRFLANEAPEMPIYGCTNPQCTCAYSHHDDRRNGDDRRYPSITMEGVFAQRELRHKSDRRKHGFA